MSMTWNRYDKKDPNTWPNNWQWTVVRVIDENSNIKWATGLFVIDKSPRRSIPAFLSLERVTVTHWMEPDVDEVQA